tara:strand:+ start:112 stop:450 length:339 start_codon:yes stop_codon:yes gene_type:complete
MSNMKKEIQEYIELARNSYPLRRDREVVKKEIIKDLEGLLNGGNQYGHEDEYYPGWLDEDFEQVIAELEKQPLNTPKITLQLLRDEYRGMPESEISDMYDKHYKFPTKRKEE